MAECTEVNKGVRKSFTSWVPFCLASVVARRRSSSSSCVGRNLKRPVARAAAAAAAAAFRRFLSRRDAWTHEPWTTISCECTYMYTYRSRQGIYATKRSRLAQVAP